MKEAFHMKVRDENKMKGTQKKKGSVKVEEKKIR